MAQPGSRRRWAWVGVTVGGLVTVGLIVLVVAADLDTAGQVAGIVGTVVGVAGLGVSLYALNSQPTPSPSPSSVGGVVAGGARSAAVGGSVSGAVVTGDGARTGATPTPGPPSSAAPSAPPEGGVRASGERSVAVGGDVSGQVSTGDGAPSAGV
ncbi:hypothetical protein [Streptomyces sp. NPDC087300]|uniref:hypothetical protein n=1 Tax=Streptomyces sp. NPDC087300 TaxID=3365780 RepID=UPI00382679E5